MPLTRRQRQEQEQQQQLPQLNDKKRTKVSQSAKDQKNDAESDDEERHSNIQHNDDTQELQEEEEDDGHEDEEEEEDHPLYELDGVTYKTYQDFVQAKRERNQKRLQDLGFEQNKTTKKRKSTSRAATSTTIPTSTRPARKSSRLSGDTTNHVALNYSVKDRNFDKSIVKLNRGEDDDDEEEDDEHSTHDTPSYYKGRLTDGSDLTIEQAMRFNQTKLSQWTLEPNDETGTLQAAKDFFHQRVVGGDPSLDNHHHTATTTTSSTSPTSVMGRDRENDDDDDDKHQQTHIRKNIMSSLQDRVDKLSIEDEEWVTKVTPERIYSIAVHPSTSKILVCAGDKVGHVGFWDVTASTSKTTTTTAAAATITTSKKGGSGFEVEEEENQSHYQHLVRAHSGAICCLEWTSSTTLISASYDSTVRCFNAETGTFQEIFGTYDDSDSYYAEYLGYGLDQGYRYWIQHVSVDHRRYQGNGSGSGGLNPNLFLSTSVGTAMHVDLRSGPKERITFHESLSDKKLNTLSLHPNGHSLASAGLDGMVRLWDIRKLGDSRHKSRKTPPKEYASFSAGYSISSSYFSPSGQTLLTTSFADRLDLMDDAHLAKTTTTTTQTATSIKHNNKTGRWLSTFMAQWHATEDVFVVGSMNKPRSMELFDGEGKLLRAIQGEALSSVMSRCVMHPSPQELIVVGGNGSGRVAVVR